jgi:hypothetical protein
MAAFLASVTVTVNSFLQTAMSFLCMDGAGSDDDDDEIVDDNLEELRAKLTAAEFAEVLIFFDESLRPAADCGTKGWKRVGSSRCKTHENMGASTVNVFFLLVLFLHGHGTMFNATCFVMN